MKQRFAALDGWRGICAVLVALHHFPANGSIAGLPLVRNAWLFVDFFFVLSGFVIAHAYGGELGTPRAIAGFARRRWARLWPLHVCVLAAFVALEAVRWAQSGNGFSGDRSPLSILTNLALVQSLGIHGGLTWNTPSWSISTEFYTYLVYAAASAIAVGRARRSALAALTAAGGLGILVAVSRYGMRETFDFGFFRCLYGFFVGTLVYELRDSKRLAPSWAAAGEWLAASLALGFLIYVAGDRPLEYFATPIFALVVFVFAQEAGPLSRLMRLKPIAALGRWSYSIYMVHMLVLAMLMSVLNRLGFASPAPDGAALIAPDRIVADAATLGWLALVLAVSAATWRFIERPGQSWLSGRPVPARGSIDPANGLGNAA